MLARWCGIFNPRGTQVYSILENQNKKCGSLSSSYSSSSPNLFSSSCSSLLCGSQVPSMPRCTHKYLPGLNKEQGKKKERKKTASEKTWKITAAVGNEASSSPSPPPFHQITKIYSGICFGFCVWFCSWVFGAGSGRKWLRIWTTMIIVMDSVKEIPMRNSTKSLDSQLWHDCVGGMAFFWFSF